ncbi:MAG: putative glycoside hydrolase [Candidatus Berkiellales bacterium]
MMVKKSLLIFISLILIFAGVNLHAQPSIRGIYINQGTLENLSYLKQLINESKAVGINTFVIDLAKETKNYRRNVQLVQDSGIRYVARIVVFPDGGRSQQIKSMDYWKKRFKLVETAIRYGADEIQLDYIRYSSKQAPSAQNAKDVKQVIKWFKGEMAAYKIPLQIDIFGEVSFKESPRIGQNIQLFADTIDGACPMVYPSHYHPYQTHSKEPYNTVYKSLIALKDQFGEKLPFKLVPFVEASNYHYKLSSAQKAKYVLSQIRAAEDAKADGWYVWSPQNIYKSLFSALKNRNDVASKSKGAGPRKVAFE